MNWSYQLLPNPDASGDKSRIATLDRAAALLAVITPLIFLI